MFNYLVQKETIMIDYSMFYGEAFYYTNNLKRNYILFIRVKNM